MSARRDNLIVGLDIGTTKICAIVGNVTEDGIEIVGIGTSPSTGLRKGVVINIESTVASIKKAVEEEHHGWLVITAEKNPGTRIELCFPE